MISLVYNEIQKIMGKWRSSLGFILIGLLMPLIIWGFSVGGEEFQREQLEGIKDSFVMVGSIVNGFLVTYFVMNFLWVHIPFLIMLVSGDIVAGEGSEGTYRIYLTRSVSRYKIILAKWLGNMVYILALLSFAALMSLGLGTLWLGSGDLIVFQDGILVLPADMAIMRFALSFFFVLLAMGTISTLCFLFSTFVNNGIGPLVGAMSVLIIGLAVANIPLSFFETLRPWLFTSYLDVWKKAFFDPIPWGGIIRDVLVLAGHMALFLGIAIVHFSRKDILT
ncbi:MAG: ABC transporter permease [Fidelibacterota bacterium]